MGGEVNFFNALVGYTVDRASSSGSECVVSLRKRLPTCQRWLKTIPVLSAVGLACLLSPSVCYAIRRYATRLCVFFFVYFRDKSASENLNESRTKKENSRTKGTGSEGLALSSFRRGQASSSFYKKYGWLSSNDASNTGQTSYYHGPLCHCNCVSKLLYIKQVSRDHILPYSY